MATWAFYSDAGLSSALSELSCTQTTSTFHVWFGSTTSGYKLIPATSGATGIYVVCNDSATGGHAVSAIKMASGSAGLAGASGGANYDLGAAVFGGVANAAEFWIQVTDAVGSGAKSTELSLSIEDSAAGGLYQTAT